MPKLKVGKTLYGYCEGYFGHNWNDKIIEAIGRDWIVVRDSEGYILTATFPLEEGTKKKYLKKFLEPEKDYEEDDLELKDEDVRAFVMEDDAVRQKNHREWLESLPWRG